MHGGHAHPLQLVQANNAKSQRADFLKSRPRFDQSYFDGQRDPAEGWMSAWNAWRFPTFYSGPASEKVIFTFQPPHTLHLDAKLQALHDADLIQSGDRVNYEHIIDAVTHQPLGRQAALKGPDGIFYWDLSSSPKAEGPHAATTSQSTQREQQACAWAWTSPFVCFTNLRSARARVQLSASSMVRTRLRATCARFTMSGGLACRRTSRIDG